MLTSRECQPTITSFIESGLDLAGATNHRSQRKNMGLDVVELVLEVEETFGIDIPDAVAAEMITPGIMIAYVQNAVASCPDRSRKWTHDEVRQVIRKIISEQLGVKSFTDTDEFVRDLGID